ncbi:MAG: protein arginine kinase [Acutalibacteraceae bacterium]
MSEKWYEKAGQQGGIVVSSRIRLARNLKNYPFPNKASLEQKKEIAQKVKLALEESNSTLANSFSFISMEELSQIQAVSLVEKHLISPEFASDRKGRYLMLSKDESISIMINEEDHIRIQVLGSGLSLNECYDTANNLDTLLDNALGFAFNNKLGYLTQCPTNLGTGMRASLMLHVPAIEKNRSINRISGNLTKLGMELRGTFGEGSDAKGSLYQLSNQITLGLSEHNAIENLKNIASQLIEQEEKSLAEMAKSIETQDVIYRSLALLKSAKLMSNDEAMKLISNVRAGMFTGVIKNTDYAMLNRLNEQIQPATLMTAEGKELSPQQRDIKRAEILNREFGRI